MFERLVSKVLSRLLSKYFTEECLARNKVATSAQLGVWSGYISLKDLELKTDVINRKLQQKGLPFEIVHCSFRSVEITIPWAKLSNPISSSTNARPEDGGVVVVVLDGIHLLARTNFSFHDLALREASVKERRKALQEALVETSATKEEISYTEMLKKRITDGLLEDVLNRLNIHIRDLHIRLEDVECDPGNPFACGITLESMHIQHDEEEADSPDFVSKVAMWNHFAVYWNAVKFGEAASAENSLLHVTCGHDTKRISQSLDACISRRATSQQVPTHTYILLPIDGSLHGRRATSVAQANSVPAFEAVATIDVVSAQIRDFQLVQILSLVTEMKNHNFIKKYRKFRPLSSVKENPRAWWLYAARVIRYQLRESFLRWSWSSFEKSYRKRARYMDLYERKIRYPSRRQDATIAQLTGGESDILDRSRRPDVVAGNGPEAETTFDALTTAPDEGAGPSIIKAQQKEPLNGDEILELQDMEDGIRGDLSIHDILMFRGVVNLRMGRNTNAEQVSNNHLADDGYKSSWWTQTVEQAADDDMEAQAEFDRLLKHLEEVSNGPSYQVTGSRTQTAISLAFRLEKVHLAVFAPLHITTEETQLRRIHEKFLNLDVLDIRACYSLKGDYSSSDFQLSIYDIIGTEIRRDKSQQTILKYVVNAENSHSGTASRENSEQSDASPDPFLAVTLSSNPTADSACEVELVVFLNKLEIVLSPDCQFISNARDMFRVVSKVPSVVDFWDGLSMAYFNSIAMGRLGLLLKESAAEDHKNMDIEITIQCPVLRIGGGSGRYIFVDFGIAQFKTEKLAGISRNKMHHIQDAQSDATELRLSSVMNWSQYSDEFSGSIPFSAPGSHSIISNKRKAARASSAYSVDLGNESFTGSEYMDDAYNFQQRDSTSGKRSQDPGNYNALFYDVYKLEIQTGMVSITENEASFCLTNGFEILTTIKKSVIPSDPTLCKLITHTIVGNVDFLLNDQSMMQILTTVKGWKTLLAADPAQTAPLIAPASARKSMRPSKLEKIPTRVSDQDTSPNSEYSDDASTSQIDENEFFDADDGGDSGAAANSGIWFDDNWINDAESVMSASSNHRRSRRRQAKSISDVSSASSQSLKGRRRNHAAYLSAENLAKLEENAREEESVESGVGSDDISFHSVLSPDGQASLLNDIEKDIVETEAQIAEMNRLLSNLRCIRLDDEGMSSSMVQSRSKDRRDVKLKLRRAESELKALKALQIDLTALVSGDQEGPHMDSNDGTVESRLERMEHAREAKLLLDAKRKYRNALAEGNSSHNLTKRMNRELFQASILCNQFKVTLLLNENQTGKTEEEDTTVFELIASKCGIALFNYAQDKKIYFSTDQITANLQAEGIPKSFTCLLSGGSSDTVLPTHLPHLISHSMEERFLRGALHLGNRRSRNTPSSLAKIMKLRLVVGDIEVCPCEHYLSRIVSFLGKILPKAQLPENLREDNGITSNRSLLLSSPESLRRPSAVCAHSGVFAAEKPTALTDLAIRFASTRVMLSDSNHAVGAVAASEVSMRFVRVSSSLKHRMQMDARITNFQLIEIENLESGHCREILGRRDPYSSIVQIRVRSEVVPSYEAGGWVVGGSISSNEKEPLLQENSAQNIHVGAKLNPVSILACPDGIMKLHSSLMELKRLTTEGRSSATRTHPNLVVPPENPSLITRLLSDGNLRWRVDVSFRRVSIGFPSDQPDLDWSVGDQTSNNFLLSFSFSGCVQQSAMRQNCLSLQMALTEMSLIRASDDWPVLEPFSMATSFSLEHGSRSQDNGHTARLLPPQLKINNDSPLDEVASALRRCGCSSFQVEELDGDGFRLRAKITTIRGNYSAPIIGLLLDTVEKLKTIQKPRSESRSLSIIHESTGTPKQVESSVGHHRSCDLNVFVQGLEHQLFKETDARSSIAHADPLFSIVVSDVSVGYEVDDMNFFSVRIHSFSLFDLSSSRGVRVVGEDPGRSNVDNPDFVYLELRINEASNALRTISLDIKWGHVQCILLPSFFRSILSVKKELEGMTQNTSKRNSGRTTSEKLVTKIVEYPNNLNIIFKADAKSFECVLSSKDISDHIRAGSNDPIGVVSFRWAASLNIAVALDCLRWSTTQWVTLNVNERFAEPNEIPLFKNFADRYLAQSSGFFAGSDEIGRRLQNAFTVRTTLDVAAFEILRTNIECMTLVEPPQNPGVPYKYVNRVYFKTRPPLAGEQRITNQIDLNLDYKCAGVSMSIMPENEFVPPRVETSQILQLKANYVDVLLYISKSDEGFTEALRVTVKPILDMLKSKDTKRAPEDDEDSDKEADVEQISRLMPTPISILRSASTVCTIQLEGFQVTCVPGGATRLNAELPIIKFELANFNSGIAGTLVPKDVRLITGKSRSQKTSPQNLLSGVDVMHLTIAGWMVCDIAAHYHNRRLVAWEPFVEPWAGNVSFGVDLVETLKLQPTMKTDIGELVSLSLEDNGSSFDPFDTQPGNSGSGDYRFKDFGRLFRAPFQNSSSSKPVKNGSITHTDLSYLMIASASRSTILSALGPTPDNRPERETRLFSCLPGRRPMEWLYGFGRGGFLQREGLESAGHYSISALLSDARPLNINLTGALIENVLGYLENVKRDDLKPVAPHCIRNDTGMTIRFREILDLDRAKMGEEARSTTLENGSQVPLILLRSSSQSCDPHRAYIHLELGNFEDTVSRIRHDDFDIPKGSRSSFFFYKATAKIPVDTVGVHRYPLDRNTDLRPEVKILGTDSRALGWIIVRVALRGGIKTVSVESPFVLRSTVDADLLCEIRDHNGVSLLWRCLVPKSDGNDDIEKTPRLVSVPADIVPFIHDKSYRFSVSAITRGSSLSHEADFVASNLDKAIEISTPPPFSPESFLKGVVGEEEVSLTVSESHNAANKSSVESNEEMEMVHLSVCAARTGSWSGVKSAVDSPEQRMIFFRAPFGFRNCLSLPIAIQIRVKRQSSVVPGGTPKGSTSNSNDQLLSKPNSLGRRNSIRRINTFIVDWEDIGVLDCGEHVNWTGALATDTIQLRVKFVSADGDNSRRFPGWSSPMTIPHQIEKNDTVEKFGEIKVNDADDVSLYLSVAIEGTKNVIDNDLGLDENIRLFSYRFLPATRMVSIFVPYWIVDGTKQDLEFFSGAPVAGQLDNRIAGDRDDTGEKSSMSTSGLAELLDNESFLNLPSASTFDVMMIGDKKSSQLTVRKRLTRTARQRMRVSSPWSDPIPLRAEQDSTHDIIVLSRKESPTNSSFDSDDKQVFDRLLLRSSVVAAPEMFGGHLGTKLIQVVNSYSILNETGRDIEVNEDNGGGSQIVIQASGSPHPFHFDDSKSIRFRFKEFGWTWSGYFKVRSNRREVTMRLHHKMKGQTVIVTMEVRTRKKSSTTLLIFRQSSHPPFRLENHTMHPLHFGQSSARIGFEEFDVDAMLLPYQSADFAWDEPEARRRALIVKSTSLPGSTDDIILGHFQLDRIVPGTMLKIESSLFVGEVAADGPTRVLRISDASMPRVSSFRQEDLEGFQNQKKEESENSLKSSFLVKLYHGIGVSVVDWTPQELLYVRLEDIQIERQLDAKTDSVTFSIGRIKLNNQLWVTPYPVLLKMGRRPESLTSRKRNRRRDAITVSWRRALSTRGGYGNFTLLERVDLSSEPIFVNVDGKLAKLLIRMIRRVKDIASDDKVGNKKSSSRDDELRTLLDIGSDTDSALLAKQGSFETEDSDEYPATAAIAAKLRSRPFLLNRKFRIGSRCSQDTAARKGKNETLTKPEQKYYIEKLRVSATKADLSWSGSLPGVVSSLLLRALTFERLPIRLRPFSSSHSYGNAQDHLQSLKSHYVSFWRILDLLMGLSYSPTFLFRAVVYTFRESVASVLDSWSSNARNKRSALDDFLAKDAEFQPTYDDGLPGMDIIPKTRAMKRVILGPMAKAAISAFTRSSDVADWMSSLIGYDSQSGAHHKIRGLVRSRNPRLFAHVDGMDLLVEYVEGENAGKALLSRVRMGIHLGEGYIFHTEEARQLKPKGETPADADPDPCIFMITSERVLLLDGRLDKNFCSVIWESKFLDIVHLEKIASDDVSSLYDEVYIWHLVDLTFDSRVVDDRKSKFPMNLVGGFNILHRKCILVPRHMGGQLIVRMGKVDKRLRRGLSSN